MPDMTPLQKKLADAFAKHQAGDVGAASVLYREVLAEDPNQPDALHMMGVIAQQRGNTQLGLELITLALANKPDMPLAWHNKSLLLRVAGKKAEALEASQKAVALDPGMAAAFDMSANLLRELGRLDEAAKHFERVIALDPGNAMSRSNYAVLLLQKDDLLGAYNVVKESEKLGRDSASFSLGNTLRAMGHTELALPHYLRVAKLMPDSGEAKLNAAMTHLLLGEFEDAWKLWRGLPDERAELKHIPRWQGEKVAHLLLHEEQGLGDALQCVRYIPLIRERAGKITLRLSSMLQRLMRENFPDIEVLTLEDPVPACDARAQLMQLPALCGTTLETIPAEVPYLHVRKEWREIWPARLGTVASPRIGFVWAGNPNHHNNRNRSLELPQLKPLLDAAAGHGVSLQKWSRKDEAGLREAGLFDADPWLGAFTDTAGLMMELDLIVTVDTSVAHLAGALGRPVWVLIPFDPDWRWMIGREDSPWYPTLKLYRQDAPRDWQGALARMAEDLRKFVGGDRGVLAAKKFAGSPLRKNPRAIKLPD